MNIKCSWLLIPIESETRFGYIDVKSSSVHFYVQRNGNFSRPNSIVTFEVERLNVVVAMNINTGVFTAPRTGAYHFSFSFMKDEQAKAIVIFIRKNGVNIGAAHTYALPNIKLHSSLPATLKLKSGDTVDLFQMLDGNMYSPYTHFTGWLIEEDIGDKLSLPLTTFSAAKSADQLCQVKGFPKSCQDLRCRGQTINGFYMVKSVNLDNKIDTIFCDFSKSSSTPSTSGAPAGGSFYFVCIIILKCL